MVGLNWIKMWPKPSIMCGVNGPGPAGHGPSKCRQLIFKPTKVFALLHWGPSNVKPERGPGRKSILSLLLLAF